jgi:hypothetical protein
VIPYYALLALDLANERSREAQERRLLRLAREGQRDMAEYDWLPDGDRPSVFRRGLARATAAVSLGAATAALRLDQRKAEDLGRAIAMSD